MYKLTRLANSSVNGIDGVSIVPLPVIFDDRGYLMEMVRSSSPWFNGFGQVYMTATYNGIVKAWHEHRLQTDCICCVSGLVKLVLLDMRVGSCEMLGNSSYGNLIEVFIGDRNPAMVVIPPGVKHGWRAVDGNALVINVPDREYNSKCPDEVRYRPDSAFVIADTQFMYDWSVRWG